MTKSQIIGISVDKTGFQLVYLFDDNKAVFFRFADRIFHPSLRITVQIEAFGFCLRACNGDCGGRYEVFAGSRAVRDAEVLLGPSTEDVFYWTADRDGERQDSLAERLEAVLAQDISADLLRFLVVRTGAAENGNFCTRIYGVGESPENPRSPQDISLLWVEALKRLIPILRENGMTTTQRARAG